MKKILSCFGFLVALAIMVLIAYGLETDCPDTAIYYYCGDE